MKSRFQKRHYTAIAEIVRVAKKRPNDTAAEAVADFQQELADLFARDNPKFRRATFEAACTPCERRAA